LNKNTDVASSNLVTQNKALTFFCLLSDEPTVRSVAAIHGTAAASAHPTWVVQHSTMLNQLFRRQPMPPVVSVYRLTVATDSYGIYKNWHGTPLRTTTSRPLDALAATQLLL